MLFPATAEFDRGPGTMGALPNDYRFDYSSRLTSMSATDHILCLEAVMEGNAQRVVRDVCAELGWSSGFDAYTRSITLVRDGSPIAGILSG